jgi:Cu2+-exporting ATPase
MECEGEKVYFKQGERCPVCNMYLVPIEEKLAKDPNHKPAYSSTNLPENLKTISENIIVRCSAKAIKFMMKRRLPCMPYAFGRNYRRLVKMQTHSHHHSHDHTHHHEAPKVTDEMAGKYYCPMYCEGEKSTTAM